MKKIILFSFLFLALGSKVFAQEGFKLGFRFSPQVCFGQLINDSTKQKITSVDLKSSMGFAFGLMVNYGFTDNIGLHTGVHVGVRGFGWNVPNTVFTNRQKLSTVYVPIQLKLRSPEIASSGIHIIGNFGINAEINFGNKRTYTNILGAEVIDKDMENTTLFSTSFNPSLGIDWEFDWGTLTASGVYNMGLMNVLDKTNYSGTNSRLSGIGLDLGYYF